MEKDRLLEPAGVVRKGEIVIFKEGAGLWTVRKMGYPEFTKKHLTSDEAHEYMKEIPPYERKV